MRKTAITVMGCVLAALFTSEALARDVKFEASLDKGRIAIGEAAQLGLTFYGTHNIPAPDIGNISGLEIRYVGPSTMMTVINGQMSSSITHMYTVLPLKTGKFQLGPFSFSHKMDKYTSNAVFLEAAEERVGEEMREEKVRVEEFGLEDRLFITLDVPKRTAYVNELVPVTVKFYVNRLNVSDIQLPTFMQEGFSKVEFKEPKQYRERFGGVIFDILEFRTNIFGTRPGEYKLGPARVKCNLVVKKKTTKRSAFGDELTEDDFFRDSFFDDFFTRYERYPIELKSQDAPLSVLPLPSEGRPKDFSNAIGDYQFIYSANPGKVRVGDPLTLKMEINGTGNFNTVLMPKLDGLDGFKVYEPQVKTEANRKVFTQVLIPESDKVTQTPRATFSYFDTGPGRYRTISQGPYPLQVEKGKDEAPAQVVGPPQEARESAVKGEELARDIIYIKDSPDRLRRVGAKSYRNKAFIFLLPFPLIFLVSLNIVHWRNERLRRDTAYARRLAAYRAVRQAPGILRRQLKSGNEAAFYEAMSAALKNYIGNRLHIPVVGMTYDTVETVLAAKGFDTAVLKKIKGLFESCDQVRFASHRTDELKMRDDLRFLMEVMRHMERLKL